MIREAKKYQLNIFDESYTIVSDESEVEVLKVVSHVNSIMRDIAQKTSSGDIKKISVFAALQLAKKINDLEVENKKIKEEKEEIFSRIEKQISLLSVQF